LARRISQEELVGKSLVLCEEILIVGKQLQPINNVVLVVVLQDSQCQPVEWDGFQRQQENMFLPKHGSI
jgi:hypothetical protein